MPKFVMALAFLVPLAANAMDVAPKEVQLLASKFNQTMMICPEKIWSNYNWENLQVILLYPSKDNSWVWDASKNSIQKVSNSTLPPSALGSSYEFLNSDDKIGMSLNMEDDVTEVFQLGVHEFFHHHGQEKWIRSSGSSARGTQYPIEWQPRVYRRMIFDNLKTYLESRNPKNLGQARYWYDRWVRENPSETLATTDGYEGTAEYAETMAGAIAIAGCQAADDTIRSHVIQRVQSNLGLSVSGHYFGLDAEGYEIGGLSALILRFENNNLKDWNDRVSKGETPLQILLEKVNPIIETAAPEIIQLFTKSAKRINSERGSLLDKDIKNWQDKSYVRVAAPHNWLQSNLRPAFFAQATHIGMTMIPLAITHQYISPDDRTNLNLKANSVLLSHRSTACPNQYYFALVPSSKIHLANGLATISSHLVEGTLASRLTTDENGFQFLCVD